MLKRLARSVPMLLLALIGVVAWATTDPPQGALADGFWASGARGFVIGRVEATRNAEYFAALAKTGANVARLFLPLPLDATGRGFTVAASDVALLQRQLGFARAEHIKIVLVGDFAGVERPAFWTDEAQRTSFVATWRELAATLGDDPAIAGLDLLNEPNPPSSTGSLTEMQNIWRVLAERAIAAIRAEHVSLPIVFESVAGAGALGFKGLRPLADPQVVYSFHYYTPHEITHQHVADPWNQSIPYPAGPQWGLGRWDPELGVSTIDKSRLALEMREVVAFQRRYHLPIYVGEFSCVRWAPDGSATRFVADALDIFTAQKWSWTYHEFRGWPGWDAEIASQDRANTTRSVDAPTMALLRAHLAGTRR